MPSTTITLLATGLAAVSLATATTVKWDSGYDDASRSLDDVACSDGANGLITRYGWQTQGQVAGFPYIGASSDIAGYNSPSCGNCYQVQYNGATIHVSLACPFSLIPSPSFCFLPPPRPFRLGIENGERKKRNVRLTPGLQMLAIDHAGDGLVMSQEAMNALTNNQAVALGTVQATVTQVAASECGLNSKRSLEFRA